MISLILRSNGPSSTSGKEGSLRSINGTVVDTVDDLYASSAGTCQDTSIAGIYSSSTDDVNRRVTVLDGAAEALTHDTANLVGASGDGAIHLQVLDGTRQATEESKAGSSRLDEPE